MAPKSKCVWQWHHRDRARAQPIALDRHDYYCVQCHLVGGRGGGFATPRLRVRGVEDSAPATQPPVVRRWLDHRLMSTTLRGREMNRALPRAVRGRGKKPGTSATRWGVAKNPST